jgi:hypothetical protein
MTENICKHENDTTEMLACFTANENHRFDRRPYEVYCCRECGKLINFEKRDDVVMTPDEIMQLFVDLYDYLIGETDEIYSQARALYEKLDRGLLREMPRAR